MDISTHEGLEPLEALKPEWDALLARCATPRPFLTPEWLAVSWRYFGRRHGPLVVCFRDAGRLVGLVALREERSILRRRLSFALSQADYPDFVIESGAEWPVLEAFVRWLKEEDRDWDFLRLRGVWSRSATAELLPVLAEHAGLSVCGWRVDVCPYIELPATGEEYRETMPGRKWQREHGARRTRKLTREHGEPALVLTEASELTREVMERFLALHRRGWAERGGSAVLDDERVRGFHLDVAAALAPTGMPRLFSLVVGEREVAASYGFLTGDTFFGYMMAHDPEFAAYSPGRELLLRVIEYGIGDGWKEVDMLSGGEPYKFDYTHLCRRTMDYTIARSPSRLRLGVAAAALRGRVSA